MPRPRLRVPQTCYLMTTVPCFIENTFSLGLHITEGSLNVFSILYVCMWLGICTRECNCLWRPEEGIWSSWSWKLQTVAFVYSFIYLFNHFIGLFYFYLPSNTYSTLIPSNPPTLSRRERRLEGKEGLDLSANKTDYFLLIRGRSNLPTGYLQLPRLISLLTNTWHTTTTATLLLWNASCPSWGSGIYSLSRAPRIKLSAAGKNHAPPFKAQDNPS